VLTVLVDRSASSSSSSSSRRVAPWPRLADRDRSRDERSPSECVSPDGAGDDDDSRTDTVRRRASSKFSSTWAAKRPRESRFELRVLPEKDAREPAGRLARGSASLPARDVGVVAGGESD
jgi:hypothetical protein